MIVFAFAGARRTGSLNRKLLGIAVELLRGQGVEVELGELRDYDMPLYDGDLEAAGTLPPGAVALAAKITAADALLIASPEYNFSVPGVVKNVIDWLSRLKPMPLRGKRALLLSASPSLVGGNRGLWALRVPLEGLGVHVFPEMYSLASAHQNLAGDGIADPMLAKMLEGMLRRFAAELARGTG
jgi:chromate reductase, NAD(P)H dehydrogenase (quinone)